MHCLVTHKWVIKPLNAESRLPYRLCERCGTMQRGIYDVFWKDISWETLRERAYTKSMQIQIAREPSSPWETLREHAHITLGKVPFVRKTTSRLDQLAHSLGLRRTRKSDRRGAEKRSALT
jgi:hypothetical protein